MVLDERRRAVLANCGANSVADDDAGVLRTSVDWLLCNRWLWVSSSVSGVAAALWVLLHEPPVW